MRFSFGVFGAKLILLGALLLLSAFFSGSETALFSLSRVHRERFRNESSSRAKLVLDLLSQPRRLIVTILIGNQLVNISFDTLVTQLGRSLAGPHLSDAALAALCTVAALPMVVLFGEIVPKSVALISAERWSRLSAPLIRLLERVTTPVRVLLGVIGDALVNVLAPTSVTRPAGLREDEFRALVDAVSEGGAVGARERNLIHNVFEFGERTVGAIMTPADRIYSLSYDLPMQRLVESVIKGRYSRIPIYRGRRDNIVGVLHAKELVGFSQGRLRDRALKDLLQPVLFVPRQTKCDRLFRDFQRRRSHLALVVDEYGRLAGVVTMEDLLEELFGEIRDEKERVRQAGGAATRPAPEAPVRETGAASRDLGEATVAPEGDGSHRPEAAAPGKEPRA